MTDEKVYISVQPDGTPHGSYDSYRQAWEHIVGWLPSLDDSLEVCKRRAESEGWKVVRVMHKSCEDLGPTGMGAADDLRCLAGKISSGPSLETVNEALAFIMEHGNDIAFVLDEWAINVTPDLDVSYKVAKKLGMVLIDPTEEQ